MNKKAVTYIKKADLKLTEQLGGGKGGGKYNVLKKNQALLKGGESM